MKTLISAFALLLVSAAVQAETIILAPGESVTDGNTKIVCSNPEQLTGQSCNLLGYGSYNGNTWRYRVSIDDKVISATDTLANALEIIKKYRDAGLCTAKPTGICKLLGSGSYAGNTWNYRIAINEDVVAVSDSQDDALNAIISLRSAQICK
jgi:hypothetical protein